MGDGVEKKKEKRFFGLFQIYIGAGPWLVIFPSFFLSCSRLRLGPDDQTTKASPWSENLQTFFG
jgi:hypothetical protein